MNGVSKNNGNKKGQVKSLQPLDLNRVALKPPVPPPVPISLPNLSAIAESRTPPKVNSPKDETEIIVNGNVLDLDDEMNIKPMTPPPMPRINTAPPIPMAPIETGVSPNRYVPENIRVFDSPPKVLPPPPERNKNVESQFWSEFRPKEPTDVSPEKPATKDSTPVTTIYDEDSPKTTTTAFTTKTNKTAKTTNTTKSNKSLFNMLPKFNKSTAPVVAPVVKAETPDTLPRVKSPANPYQFMKEIEVKPEEDDEDEEDNVSEVTHTPDRSSPVGIPMPIFNAGPRVVSPVQTIGPHSPSIVRGRPNFTEQGKSSTPRKAVTPEKPPASPIRAKTPPPLSGLHLHLPNHQDTRDSILRDPRHRHLKLTISKTVFTSHRPKLRIIDFLNALIIRSLPRNKLCFSRTSLKLSLEFCVASFLI